jgi:hypothetical protein
MEATMNKHIKDLRDLSEVLREAEKRANWTRRCIDDALNNPGLIEILMKHKIDTSYDASIASFIQSKCVVASLERITVADFYTALCRYLEEHKIASPSKRVISIYMQRNNFRLMRTANKRSYGGLNLISNVRAE